jgi:hypothetical protein
MRARTFRRLLIMIIALIGLVYGFMWWINQGNDFQLTSDTKGLIAAQKLTDSGSVAVTISTDGKVTEAKGYRNGAEDRDIAWDPEGNRVFFISDRKDDSFHIFRWDAQRNSDPDQKSIDKAGRSNLAFDAQSTNAKELSALVTVRGTVQEFFPKSARSQQVMPPSSASRLIGDAEEGSGSTMELIYKRYGTSFRIAKWMKERRFIAAVMRREEVGESLLIQDFAPDDKGEARQPQLLFSADKFFMTIDPSTGNLIVAVLNVYPPKGDDGKTLKLGFVHGIFIFDPTLPRQEALKPVALSATNEACFAQLAVSPDGAKLLFTSGPYTGDGNLKVQGLVTCPLQMGGGQSGTPIVSGSVADPTFNADGSMIAFVKREGNRRPIFVAESNGSSPRSITGESGDFANPIFSPQKNK